MAPEREELVFRGAMLPRMVPCPGPPAADLIPRYEDTKHLLNQRHMDTLCIGSLAPSFPIPYIVYTVPLQTHFHGAPEWGRPSHVDGSEESENR